MKLSNEMKVALVTVACVLVLVILLKKVLEEDINFVSQYGPVWIYIAYLITRNRIPKTKSSRVSLLWSLSIILATIGILGLYAM